MEDQLMFMFESFKQELRDIYTTNEDALFCTPSAWWGEASTEYINTLRIPGGDILAVIQQLENLQEKVNVFVSNTNTQI